ncbi:kynureninase [bacterium]|nr:MAG: kynureninase [bacterium]
MSAATGPESTGIDAARPPDRGAVAGGAPATVDRAACAALDRADPLAPLRDAFTLPAGVVYLDGNSLGPPVAGVRERMAAAIDGAWGTGLIRSWNTAGWIDAPLRLGDKIARLIGAPPGSVAVCDSTSVNVFKLVVAALRARPDRGLIVTEGGNFPTDLYMAQGALDVLPGPRAIRYARGDAVVDAIDADTALVMLTHVDYRSGRMHDMAAVTRAAHAAGALVLWDLAHSAGAVPVDLAGAGADLAVGCTYKYLNGGPGAPAFLYVAPSIQDALAPALSGWMGHAAPFAFDPRYTPAPGIRRHLVGTPPILALVALEAALEVWDRVDMAAVRAKSVDLTELFVALVDARCAGHGLALASPRDAAVRGSQVALAHPEAYAVMQALIARGVIGDFREPDVMRFGFAPLYVRHVDVWDAVEALRDVLATRAWDTPAYRTRAAVT